jgi:hypothetical protein
LRHFASLSLVGETADYAEYFEAILLRSAHFWSLGAEAGAASLLAQSDYQLNANRRSTLGDLIERKVRETAG